MNKEQKNLIVEKAATTVGLGVHKARLMHKIICAENGRIGGMAKSRKKTAACRKNGMVPKKKKSVINEPSK